MRTTSLGISIIVAVAALSSPTELLMGQSVLAIHDPAERFFSVLGVTGPRCAPFRLVIHYQGVEFYFPNNDSTAVGDSCQYLPPQSSSIASNWREIRVSFELIEFSGDGKSTRRHVSPGIITVSTTRGLSAPQSVELVPEGELGNSGTVWRVRFMIR